MKDVYISVPVEADAFVALVRFLEGEGAGRDPVTVVGEAIDFWMDYMSWHPDQHAPNDHRRGETATAGRAPARRAARRRRNR